MVGLVLVSHSVRLAEAAVELALQMVPGKHPPIALAAGAGEGVTGTDATRVAEAIQEVASPKGVLVLMDLGSAVLSAEMALEFLPEAEADVPVRLVAAPFVEGALAAVVLAAAGASLDEVAAEANGALVAKTAQLAGSTTMSGADSASDADADADADSDSDEAAASNAEENLDSATLKKAPTADAAAPADAEAEGQAEVRLVNRMGLHARPAAQLAGLYAGLDARVQLAAPELGRPAVNAASPIGLMSLGAGLGALLAITATGPDAEEAVRRIREAVQQGFGEEIVADAVPSADPNAAADTAAESLEPPKNPEPPAGEGSGVSAKGASSPAQASGEPGAASTSIVAPSGRITALGVSPGRAVGPVLVMPQPVTEPRSRTLSEAERAAEAERLRPAVDAVRGTLLQRAERLDGGRSEANDTGAAVLRATAELAVDSALVERTEQLVHTEGLPADAAVWRVYGAAADDFAGQGGMLAERAADVRDVRARLVAELQGRPAPGVPEREEPYVLVAINLAPADTAVLDPARCLALVTEQGGPTSHTAILARSLGIPALVAVRGATALAEGTVVLVDGNSGELVVEPDAAERERAAVVVTLPEFSGKGATADGYPVALLANLGGEEDVAEALAQRAEGVGLFRTEFCFLAHAEAPTVAEQVAAYRPVLARFPGKKVVLRTLDAGADKPLPFLHDGPEENPALGVRGFRTARLHPDVLDDQLRAIAEAAAAEQANVWVMAPMIATSDEAAEFQAMAERHGLPIAGVMVETPAAALSADRLAETVGFISIGTNDLAQYTLAADRMLGELAELNDPWQPAMLRMMSLAVRGAVGVGSDAAASGEKADVTEGAAGIPAGVCGEAASDPLLAPVLVGFGVSSLSMAPRAIPAVAAVLASVTLAECRALAAAALAADSAQDARAAVRAGIPALESLGL